MAASGRSISDKTKNELLRSITSYSNNEYSNVYPSNHCKKGTIHSIWFKRPNSQLNENVIPNLAGWAMQIGLYGFNVILWTNTNELSLSEIQLLSSNHIKIKDYSFCEQSRFYDYIQYFLKLGVNGDTTALALASDILRMGILELTHDDQYFIYADPNDVKFKDLENSVKQLDSMMQDNKLGFCFYAMPLTEDLSNFHIRNDVLVAKKDINPDFFKDYFIAYLSHLAAKYKEYYKPEDDNAAQYLAREISNSVTEKFFKVIVPTENCIFPIIRARFGNYVSLTVLVNVMAYLPYKRLIEFANTWLPMHQDSSSQSSEESIQAIQAPISIQHVLKFSIFASSYIQADTPARFLYVPGKT